jgi:Ni,Fe-hydrogenase I cytochrome b subunit
LPKVITTPLAIIAIHLEGLMDRGSIMTYHHLAEWLQGNLVMVDLTFNFDDTNNQFESQLDIMLDGFETGKFKEYVCLTGVLPKKH